MKKKFLPLVLCLLMLGSFLVLPPVLQAATAVYVPTSTVIAGETYMFVAPGIRDCQNVSYPECALKSVMSGSPYGLAYGHKPTGSISNEFLWKVESAGNGAYYLKSMATGQYLNMAPGANGKGSATLSSSKQALNLVLQGGKVRIAASLQGATYYVRFTNTYAPNSCWEAGTADSSSLFTMYKKGGTSGEYNNTSDPLFTVACFADLHIDYGIQSWSTPIRQGTIKAASLVRSMGGADVVLVGGDITSNNGGNLWNTNLINKARDTVYETMAMASKDGKVMLISGNHENEAGTVSRDGDVIYSGDYDKYMIENIGAFKDSLRFNDMGLGTSKYNELLCYRYTIGKMEFIGINTPYRTKRSNGYIYLEQIEWMEDQLAEIGKEKTVFVFCHYPIDSSSAGILNAPGQTGANAKMDSVLKKYPNVIYCYGHVHGDDFKYASYFTSELVIPQGTVERTSSNAYITNGYITAHMGSMGYYNNKFQPGGLKIDEPMINQLLLVDFYSDHITFRYYNSGAKSSIDGVYKIESFTVMRDMSSQLSGSSGSGSGSSGSGSVVRDPDLNWEWDDEEDYFEDDPYWEEDSYEEFDTDSEGVVDWSDTDSGSSTDAVSGTTDSDTPQDGEGSSGADDSSSDGGTPGAPKDKGNGSDPSGKKKSNAGWIFPVAIVAGVLLLGGGGTALVFVLKKKKAAAPASGEPGGEA